MMNGFNSSRFPTLGAYLNQSHPDYLTNVAEHWLQQSPPNPLVQKFLAGIMLVISAPSQICQLLVIFVFLRTRRLRTSSNKLLVSLSIADFAILCMADLVIAQNLLGPILGTTGCKIYGFVASTAALAEIWTLVLISIDRCQAIFHPLETEKRMSSSQVHLYLSLLWLLALVLSFLPLIGWNQYTAEAYLLGCSFDSFSNSWSARSYVYVLTILAWVVPVTVIGFCYCRIITSVRLNLFSFNCTSSGTSEARAEEENRARKIEISLGKMVFVILLVWMLAWTPYVILSGWIMFLDGTNLTPELAIAPTLCCKMSAAVNAFLYGVRLPKFKKEIQRLMSSPSKNGKLPSRKSQGCNGASLKEMNGDVKNVISEEGEKELDGIGSTSLPIIRLREPTDELSQSDILRANSRLGSFFYNSTNSGISTTSSNGNATQLQTRYVIVHSKSRAGVETIDVVIERSNSQVQL